MIKFTFYFALSFFILSFPMGDKKLFYYIDTVTSPLLSPTYNTVSSVGKEKFYDIKIWAMNLIDNSKSTALNSTDDVTTSYSAPEREQNSIQGSPEALERKSEINQAEYYSDEEVKKLEAMLRNADN